MKYRIIDLNFKYINDLSKLYVKLIHKHFKNTIVDEELNMWTYEGKKKDLKIT